MKILVLDVDQAHNKKISLILGSAPDTQLVFFSQPESIIEILNGNPVAEQKKNEIQKLMADSKAILQKVSDTITNAQKKKQDKQEILKQAVASKDQANQSALEKEISEITNQITKESELKTKIETTLAGQQKSLDEILKTTISEDQKKCHLIMADRSFLGNKPATWVQEFRDKITYPDNKEIPLIVMGYNETLDHIRETIAPGVNDYFVKPVDALLLKHNAYKIAGKKLDSDEKTYELPTNAPIKLLQIATVIKMSEFEMDVQTRLQFKEKELGEFYADVFSKEKSARLLARCLKSEPDPNEKELFVTQFSFAGLSPANMTELRKWLRLQYVEIKQKSSEG